MRMLLLGPPGGGKGTQGARLSAQLGVAHIAVGDLLRQEVSAETPLGVRVAEYMTRGELVPDELIIDALTPRLVATEGFILDGFPRTLAQAQTADEAIPLDVVVYLDVREQELRRRLLARAELEGRADDTPDVIARRLHVYADATAPLIELYRERGRLVEIDGEQAAEAITDQVLALAQQALSPSAG